MRLSKRIRSTNSRSRFPSGRSQLIRTHTAVFYHNVSSDLLNYITSLEEGWVGLPRTHSHLAVGLLTLGEGANGQSATLDQQRKTCRILELSIPEFQSKCKQLSCLHPGFVNFR